MEDLNFWKKSGQKQIQQRITVLLQSIVLTPFAGIRKPEALKHEFTGMWSRRINKTHRLVYEVKDNDIYIHSLKDHY